MVKRFFLIGKKRIEKDYFNWKKMGKKKTFTIFGQFFNYED